MTLLRSLSCWTALSLIVSGPAFAAQATPDGAQRLTDLFQRYIGKPAAGKPSAVTVTPQGASYKVDLDIGRLLAPLAPLGFSAASATPFSMTLTEQDDALWHVTTGDLPSLAITMGKQTNTIKYDGYTFDGLFDPKLEAFTQGKSTMAGATQDVVSQELSSNASYTGQMSADQTATDAGDGSVNFVVKQGINNLTYQLHLGGQSPNLPTKIDIRATASSITGDSTISHFSTRAMLDLWAFLIANPSQDALKAKQVDLKAKVDALLAPDPGVSLVAQGKTFVFDTPVGQIGLGSMAENFELAGEKTGAHIAFGMKGDGLTLPPDKIPAWAVGLVPQAFDVSLNVAPVHLNNGLRKAVADLKLDADAPLNDAEKAEVLAAFGDPSAIVLTLNPTTISSSLLTVKASGSGHMGPGGMPVGSASVTATGLDKALEALNAKGGADPDAQQAVAFLTGMKQLGKAEAKDTYTWVIDAQPGKPVTVNGTPLAGAPPAADNDNDNSGGSDDDSDQKTKP